MRHAALQLFFQVHLVLADHCAYGHLNNSVHNHALVWNLKEHFTGNPAQDSLPVRSPDAQLGQKQSDLLLLVVYRTFHQLQLYFAAVFYYLHDDVRAEPRKTNGIS